MYKTLQQSRQITCCKALNYFMEDRVSRHTRKLTSVSERTTDEKQKPMTYKSKEKIREIYNKKWFSLYLFLPWVYSVWCRLSHAWATSEILQIETELYNCTCIMLTLLEFIGRLKIKGYSLKQPSNTYKEYLTARIFNNPIAWPGLVHVHLYRW